MAFDVEKDHAMKRSVGSDDVGLQAERREFVFDIARFAVCAGQIAARQRYGKMARFWRGGTLRMGDAAGYYTDAQEGQAGVLAARLLHVETDG